MKSSTWQEHDYTELFVRANARRYWPELGFRDPAAQAMLERLGLGGDKNGKHGQQERQALKRSHWFDQRCEQFVARHPHALCIELGAGFSTRFHRVSSQSDWPRFHWFEVDTPEIIQQKRRVLPMIDNFQLIASELASLDWLRLWKGEPLILLAEHQLMHFSPEEVEALFKQIAHRARQLSFERGKPVPVELVFDYVSPLHICAQKILSCLNAQTKNGWNWGLNSAGRLIYMDSGYDVLTEECLSEYSSMWARWLNAGYRRFTGGKYLEACAAVTWTSPESFA